MGVGMKKMLQVLAIFGAILLFAANGLFAQQAVIRDIAGTVEVKHAGNDTWEAAQRGQILAGDSSVSTGFRSTALIALGNTLLTVRPLTRLTITELSQNRDPEKIDLNLEAGRIRAEVNPPDNAGLDFTVRSSAATASVRGTVFEFDTFNLLVTEGTVEFSGALGSSVLIDAGGTGYLTDRDRRAVRLPSTSTAQLRPDLPFASEILQPAEVDRSPTGAASSSGTSAQGIGIDMDYSD